MGSASDIVRGEIVRFSGSGNAMLETTENGEFNLGPLPDDLEGEVVRALLLSGPWALCLEPEYTTQNYVKEMSKRSGRSLSMDTIRAKLDDTTSEDDGRGMSKRSGRSPSTDAIRANLDDTATEDDVGRLIKTSYTTTERFPSYDDGKPISISCPDFLCEDGIPEGLPVRIVAIRDDIAIGVPALDTLDPDRLATNNEIALSVKRTTSDGPGLAGTTENEGYPAVVGDVVGHQGASVRASVTDVFPTHVEARLSALSDEAWPEEGSLVEFDVHHVRADGVAVGTADRLPAELPKAPDSLESAGQFTAAVVEQTDDGLTARVDEIPESERPAVGDTTHCRVEGRPSDGMWCQAEDVPVWIAEQVPEAVDDFRSLITDVTRSHLVGSINETPAVQSLTPGDEIIVRVEGHNDRYGIGRYEDIPVVVPSGDKLVDHNVRLGVSEVSDGHVVARFDALPSGTQPQVGDEIKIDAADISIESDFAVKDKIPITLPSYDSGFEGPIRLGVSSIQPNCIRCSVQELSDSTLPAVGDGVRVQVDSQTENGSLARADNVPVFLPCADIPAGETRRVLVVSTSEAKLIGIEIETDRYGSDLDSDTITTYYNSLLAARDAWQSDHFGEAAEYCETASQQIESGSYVREALKIDAERQALLLEAERMRRDQAPQNASRHVKSGMESINSLDVPGAKSVQEELGAYRLLMEGIIDGSVTEAYFNATVKKLSKMKKMDDTPWQTIAPHPIFVTLLVTIRPRDVSATYKVDRLVQDAPEYWPFLTLSRLS